MSEAMEETAYQVGTAYLIRTLTMYWTGRLMAIYPSELVLEDAAWIADTGRWHEATCTENLVEVEPREGPVIINRKSIVDACEWATPLPRKAK